MAHYEQDRYSYIRATREISPTIEVAKFLAKVSQIGSIALGFRDSTSLKLRENRWQDELEADYEPVHQGVGVPSLHVYPPNNLRYTHFEKLVPPQPGLNRLLSRLYGKVALQSVPSVIDDSKLLLCASTIVATTKPEYAALGEEYALRIDPGPLADLLRVQDEIIHRKVRGTGAGSEICGPYAPIEPAVPFMRIPTKTDETQKLEAVEWISEAVQASPLQLVARSIQWEARFR